MNHPASPSAVSGDQLLEPGDTIAPPDFPIGAEAGIHPDERLYTREFFQVFLAIGLFMTGFALQFHFAQYFAHLGYGIDTLGWVLGASMIGTLLIRLQIGRWIDVVGCKPTWICGAIVVGISVCLIQLTDNLILIGILRGLSQMAAAAVMTTVAVFAALIAPPHRRAESIGTIGLAGFLGLMIGPTLGDFILPNNQDASWPYHLFFTISALFSLASAGVIAFASLPCAESQRARAVLPGGQGNEDASSPAQEPAREKSRLRVVLRHWPGAVLLIAMAFTMVFCLNSIFLERLADARGFGDIKVFFLTYGPTAIISRILTRHLPAKVGRGRILVLGLTIHTLGVLSLMGVNQQLGLILPGFLLGLGHCFVFPSMIDLGAEALPAEDRGTGTSLVLAAGDFSNLLGYLLMGEFIKHYGFDRTFVGLASFLVFAAVVFTIYRRRMVFDWSVK